MRFSGLVALGCALAMSVSSAEAKPLERLYLRSGEKVKVNDGALKNRRFIISTQDGHRLIARQSSLRPKLSNFKSRDGRSVIRGMSGILRRGGFDANRQFVLSVGDNVLHGVFRDGQIVSTLRVKEDGASSLESRNSSDLPSCGGSAHKDLPAVADMPGQASGRPGSVAADGSVRVDVAILFSPAAAAAAGGTAAAVAEAATAVQVSNLTYVNSEISMQLNLVYAGVSSTNESGNFGTDLDRFATAGDGFFDDAQSIRSAYGADLVSLFVTNDDFCGLAYLMTTPSVGFADAGYSVVSRLCASDNFSFAHELGHNMGAQHNQSDSGGSPGAYSYSYGHRFDGATSGRYRSVMAYQSNRFETRVAYFSNPEVSYQGTATGTSNANNALTLNNTVSIVADFNAEVVDPSPPPPVNNTPIPSITPKLTKVTKTVSRKRQCKITGKIVDAATAQALGGQTVSLQLSGKIKKSTLSSSVGKFTLKGQYRKTYRVVVGSAAKKVKCQ